MDERSNVAEAGVLDAGAIAALLPKSTISKDQKDPRSGKNFFELNAEVAQRAMTRMAVNQSGGLPGLPAKSPSLFRRLLSVIERR